MTDPERILCWHTWYGGPVRNLSAELVEKGWEWYAAERFPAFAAAGFKRHVLHCPWGWQAGESMEFDAYWEATKTKGLEKVADRAAFVRAWKPWTRRGYEIGCYYGSVDGDWEVERWKKPNGVDDMAYLVGRNLKPAADAGMWIILDAAVMQPYHSVAHAIAILARACGMRVGIEANPSKDQPHWAYRIGRGGQSMEPLDYTVVALSHWWDGPGTQHGWNVPVAHFGGELILLAHDPPAGVDADWTGSGWVPGHVRDLLARPYQPSVAVTQWRLEHLIGRGVGRKELEA